MKASKIIVWITLQYNFLIIIIFHGAVGNECRHTRRATAPAHPICVTIPIFANETWSALRHIGAHNREVKTRMNYMLPDNSLHGNFKVKLFEKDWFSHWVFCHVIQRWPVTLRKYNRHGLSKGNLIFKMYVIILWKKFHLSWFSSAIFSKLKLHKKHAYNLLQAKKLKKYVSQKNFTHISMLRRQKMVLFGVLKIFISDFIYYNLY